MPDPVPAHVNVAAAAPLFTIVPSVVRVCTKRSVMSCPFTSSVPPSNVMYEVLGFACPSPSSRIVQPASKPMKTSNAGTPSSFAHTTVPPRMCMRRALASDPVRRSVPSPHLEMLA